MLTKSLAAELGKMGTNIRVNSVHPGPTNTELGRGALVEAQHLGLITDVDKGVEMVASQFPMGRWGEVVDVSGVIAFLASDASNYMHGSIVPIDGGWLAR